MPRLGRGIHIGIFQEHSMPENLHPYYLQQMGIETWTVRKPTVKTVKLMVVADALDSSQAAKSLLVKMLGSIGLALKDVSIKTGLTSKLLAEIDMNPPLLLLAAGNAAGQFFLKQPQITGTVHAYHNIPLVVSYHPADLLQHPVNKKQAWQDLLCIQQMLARTVA